MNSRNPAICLATLTLLAPVAFASQNEKEPLIKETLASTFYIYASRFEEPVENSLPQTYVITDKQIQKSGLNSVSEVLQKLGGVTVKNNLDGSTNGVVDIRGFGDAADNNVLVLLDGVRLSENEQAAARTSLIPLEAIDHIEITRGGQSVLHGDGATGGVINIITKTNLDDLTVFTAGIGSYKSMHSSIFLSKKSDDVNISLFGRQNDNSGYRNSSGVAERSVGFSAIKHLSESNSLGIRASVSNERNKLPGALPISYLNSSPRASQVSEYTSTTHVETRNVTLFGGFKLRPDLLFKIDLSRSNKSNKWNYYYNASDVYEGYNPAAYPGQSPYAWGDSNSDSHTDSVNPRLKFDNFITKGGVLIVGYDWREYKRSADAYKTNSDSHYYNEAGTSTNIYDGSNGSQSFRTSGNYIRTELPFGAKDSIIMGVRKQAFRQQSAYNYYNGGNTASCSPFWCDPSSYGFNNAGSATATEVQYVRAFQENFKAYLRTSRNFRFANLDDNLQAPFVQKNNLNPQTSRDYEVGLNYRGSRLNTSLVFFQSLFNNEIGFDGSNNINYDPTKRQGIESVSSYGVSSTINLTGSLNLSDAKFIDGQYSGKTVPGTSFVTGAVGVQYQFSAKESLAWQTRFSSNAFASSDMDNAQTPRPGFGVSDISYVYSEKKWQVISSINNVFNKKYTDSAIYKSAYYPLYQLTVYPNPGRNLSVTGRYSY